MRGCWAQKDTPRRESFLDPYIDFWGNACNHPAINKGREARELRMATRHLGPTDETQLHNVAHNHRIKDCLHHIRDVRVLSVLCSHAKVKTRAEVVMIYRERRPSKGVPDVFRRHLGTRKVWKADHFASLSLSLPPPHHSYLFSLKVRKMCRESLVNGNSLPPFMEKEAARRMLPFPR
ncbi:hypothetical protein Cgig2_009443 [Carnegiea gigantea]|uniref:Uncharacterized protein n=1 Tax=Carnegiea gigantea TaxID=171969 RepID=A0A9Q1GGQ5_9CARY|nr:hypothetical protein Cgig2_009443 [Carnegiea gigantea]